MQGNREAVPKAVGLYITSAYWFTASTSLANPAVTIARSMTDTFAGLNPTHAPVFIAAQLLGAVEAPGVCRMLVPSRGGQPASPLKAELSEPSP